MREPDQVPDDSGQGLPRPEPWPQYRVMPGAKPARNRPLLHLMLLLATVYTMTLAGALSEAPRLSLDPEALTSWAINPRFLQLGLPYSLCLLAILGCHEMGHYLACRRYGVDASLPFFLPSIPVLGTFGAFIRIRAPIPSRNVLFDIGVAGPLAGFAVMVPVLVYGILTAQPVPIPTEGSYVYSDDPLILTWLTELLGPRVPEGQTVFLSGPLMAAWVGCLATAINLFPVGQLDGGHLCYAISSRFHRRASLAGIVAFVAIGLLLSPSWLFFATLLVILGPKHPPVIDETEELSAGRKLVAIVALVVLIACFIPRPFSLVES